MAGTSKPATPSTHTVHWEELPRDAWRDATTTDVVSGVMPQRIFAPRDEQELSEMLAWCNAHELRVAVRGGGTKLDWGNPPAGVDVVVSTEKFARVIEHAWQDMTATVQAGVTIADLQHTLAAHRQRLATDPLWPQRATVGGVVVTNDNGPLRLRFGGIRDLIIGATIVLADGTIARSGGKVVKNVAGYDLPKLITGSFGTLGVITEATFRLHPLPHESRTLTFSFSDPEAANRFVLQILDSTLVPSSVQIRTGDANSIAVDVLFEGTAAGIDAQTNTLAQLAPAQSANDQSSEIWSAGQKLWDGAHSLAGSLICRFSVLPTQLSTALQMISRADARARVVVQAIGLGLIRFDFDAPAAVPGILRSLRDDLLRLHGSLVVLHCPAEIRKQVDSWGPVAAQSLMLRIKQQFDPKGTLNPGRFVGGI